MYIYYHTSTSHNQDFTEGSFAQPCWSKIGEKFLTQMVDAIEKAQAICLENRHDQCRAIACSCEYLGWNDWKTLAYTLILDILG